jgi:hypothetical protein
MVLIVAIAPGMHAPRFARVSLYSGRLKELVHALSVTERVASSAAGIFELCRPSDACAPALRGSFAALLERASEYYLLVLWRPVRVRCKTSVSIQVLSFGNSF